MEPCRFGVSSRRFEERFLHCASRQLRRSEAEEKASARSGRNDRFGWCGLDEWQDQEWICMAHFEMCVVESRIMALLDEIADGRTDLVFEYVAQGNSAASADAGGVSAAAMVRVLRGRKRDQIFAGERRDAGCARRELRSECRELSRALAALQISAGARSGRESSFAGYREKRRCMPRYAPRSG